MDVSSPRLKVCHVFAGLDGGRWVHEQLEALRDQHDFEVTAALPQGPARPTDPYAAARIPVARFDFRFRRWRSLCTIPLTVIRLAWWFRSQRFDVVQSHVIKSTLFARPAAWLADVPVRLEMVTSPYYMQAEATRCLERATAWMDTGIIPSCELTGRLYREAGIDPRRVHEPIYYGPREDRFDPENTPHADVREELSLPAGTPLVGSVAIFYRKGAATRMVPPEVHEKHLKGHADLIRAMPFVLAEFPQARLLLAGSGWGPEGQAAESEVRAMAVAEGLGDRVIFLGYRTDIAEIYMDLDVSVQASLTDNLGGTIESLLMARPTIATRVGGLVDSVVDGETGILVNPGDPADLARAILHLLRDPEEAKRLGAAGRRRMLSGFTLATTATKLAEFYRAQRRAAPGAYRLHVSLMRLATALLVHGPRLTAILLIELYRLKRPSGLFQLSRRRRPAG